MLGFLDGIDEYNNAGALIGIDSIGDVELLGALKKMNAVKRQKTINKLASTGVPSRGSRADFEKVFKEVPPHIKEGLLKGDLRLADGSIYSVKPVVSRVTKMFETQDDKEVGLRSVSNAKLPKNQVLVVSGIMVSASVSADGTKDKVVGSEFKGLEAFNSIANGEFFLKANKKYIVPETGNHIFKTANFHLVPLGYYKLNNPRLIVDDVLIEFNFELGSMEGIAANTNIRVELFGTTTTP